LTLTDRSKVSTSQRPDKKQKTEHIEGFIKFIPDYKTLLERAGLSIASDVILPVVSGNPSGWRERWASVCDDCFKRGIHCSHYDEKPLKLLLLGHNPSQKTWEVGVAYGNPSNRFWTLLRKSEILPSKWREDDQLWRINNMMPHELGIGISDIGCFPGSDAAEFGHDVMLQWREDFYKRARAHLHRCCSVLKNGEENKKRKKNNERVKEEEEEEHRQEEFSADELDRMAPRIVAFTGKRHYSMLFQPQLKKVDSYGKQDLLPPRWPFPASTEVWILPSPSGRAAMSSADREAPYLELSQRLLELKSE